MVQAVGLKTSNYTLKIEGGVKFGAISWQIDILPLTASLKFESEKSFAQNVTHITVIIFHIANFVENNFRFLR